MEYRTYKMYMNLERYKDDFFFFDGSPDSYTDSQYKLITRLKEKALKHGFEKERYDYYIKWVDKKEVQSVKTFEQGVIDAYFVKYKDDFFRVCEETESEILLMTKFSEISRKYGLIEPYAKAWEYMKWVPREETIPIDQIPEKLAFYKELIFQILDKRDNEYLIASDVTGFLTPWFFHPIEKKSYEEGWEKVGDRHQKWIPREVLYIYGEEEIPARI